MRDGTGLTVGITRSVMPTMVIVSRRSKTDILTLQKKEGVPTDTHCRDTCHVPDALPPLKVADQVPLPLTVPSLAWTNVPSKV
jgi:hypothetical protein